MIVKMKAGAQIYLRLMHLSRCGVCVCLCMSMSHPMCELCEKQMAGIAIYFIIVVVGASSRSLFVWYLCVCVVPGIEFVCLQFNKPQIIIYKSEWPKK